MNKKHQTHDAAAKPGYSAQSGNLTLRSWTVGVLPLINQILEEMQLEKFFEQHLRPDGARMQRPTRIGLMLLVRNLLLSREPIYGMGEWAQRHAPYFLAHVVRTPSFAVGWPRPSPP